MSGNKSSARHPWSVAREGSPAEGGSWRCESRTESFLSACVQAVGRRRSGMTKVNGNVYFLPLSKIRGCGSNVSSVGWVSLRNCGVISC